MKISAVSIRNYRCLVDLDIDVSGYTALIGPNGSGKSSILYALEWFFTGQALDPEDWSFVCEEDDAVSVGVSFCDLNDADRAVLGKYCRGDQAHFRRTQSRDGTKKIIGRALQGPEFEKARVAGLKAPEVVAAYKKIRAALPELPAETGKARCEAALDQWEADPANAHRLVEIDEADATHLFGATGTAILSSRFQFVLVPASADLAAEADSGTKGSLISQIVGTLTSEAVTEAQSDWRASHGDTLVDLEDAIDIKIRAAVERPTAAINDQLALLIPGARLLVDPTALDFDFKLKPSLNTAIALDGHTAQLNRHGHGVQRALMIALLQARTELGDVGTNVLFAVEEPEIYQHPIRARHFANVLTTMSETSRSQVLIATHSPYFIDVGDYSCLRRVDRRSSGTRVRQTFQSSLDSTSGKLQNFMARQFGGSFAEAFFADVAVLVEGPNDKAILEGIADALDSSLLELGISVQAVGGKGELEMAHRVLTDLEVPTYVVADGDGHDNPVNETKRKQTEALLRWLPDSTVRTGHRPSTAGEPTCVADQWTVFYGDIEHELRSWNGFEAELSEAHGTLGDKNTHAYRVAAGAAPIGTVPEALKTLVKCVTDLVVSDPAPAER